MTFKIPRGKIVYNTNDARTHASYMLSSTIRRTTQNLRVIPYAMYRPPNIEATDANHSTHGFTANWFCSKENGTTRRERGYLKQIYSFAMFIPN